MNVVSMGTPTRMRHGRCDEQRHIVPSPLVGRDRERGARLGAARETALSCRRWMSKLFGAEFLRHGTGTTALLTVPLSLSLPHKGGGNGVASLCPLETLRSRICHRKAPRVGVPSDASRPAHRSFDPARAVRERVRRLVHRHEFGRAHTAVARHLSWSGARCRCCGRRGGCGPRQW